MKSRLVIVGCGPKALAIAAKAGILRQLGYEVPDIVIIERDCVASHWNGSSGFTDGAQFLGTPAEKDCGFPYSSTLEPQTNALMLKEYSWPAYLIARQEYGDRVDRGRPQPTHAEWGQYLTWVSEKARPQVQRGELRRIQVQGERWRIMYEEGTKQHSIDADGLMITGPGEPKRFEGQPSHHARIFDGRNFWTNIDKFKKLKREDSVGVLGAGETAAAIVVKLSQILTKDITIEIIHRHGAVFSRGESFDENRWFTDPTDWKTLSEEQRDELIERTDRGVFSVHSKRIIDQARNVNPMVMQVSKISFKHGLPLVIGKGGWERSYEYLVVANGFDPLWFVKFMDEPLMKLCPGEDNLRRRIRTDLSVDHISPRIHLPMLAAFEQGPGFPNLSCLGLLADRVLETYVRPKKARRR